MSDPPTAREGLYRIALSRSRVSLEPLLTDACDGEEQDLRN